MPEKPSRRKFLATLATGTATLTLGSAINTASASDHKDFLQDNDLPYQFVASPYLQALTPTQVSLLSITSKRGYTWVEYGIDELSNKAHTVQDGMVQANNILSCIRLTGLVPDTEYKYRIVSKEIANFAPYKLVYGQEIKSETYTFRTPKTDTDLVNAVILNDIHDRPKSYATMMGLAKDLPYDFVVLNGDLFDYQTDEKQLVNHLLKPCTDLFASEKPFILNRGNHETRGKFARELKQYLDYPEDKFYQAFRQGPVFWIMLDTGEDKPDDHPVYAGIVDYDNYRREQAVWLENIMQSKAYKKAPFKVVVMHIPPFHSGDWHGTMHCRELFSPLFEKHRVDVVLSGHTHRYGVHEPQKDHSYHIVIGGGPKEGQRIMMHLAANKEQLGIKMIKDDGTTVGSVELVANRKRR